MLAKTNPVPLTMTKFEFEISKFKLYSRKLNRLFYSIIMRARCKREYIFVGAHILPTIIYTMRIQTRI